MQLPVVIMCERSGQWAAGLRRAVGNPAVRIRDTRRLADCLAELASAPASLVALEWTRDRRAECVDFLDRLTRCFPRARAVALAERAAAADEWLAREAGVIHFVASPRRLQPVARLIARHLSHFAAAAGLEGSAEAGQAAAALDQFWHELPWNFQARNADE